MVSRPARCGARSPRCSARSSPLRALVLLASLFGPACGAAAAPDTILVAAASDMARAMPELVAGFQAATGMRVDVTLGSSGQLAQQILQGAPVDVFLSADAEWIERLAEGGRIEPGSDAVYAHGALVMLAGRMPAPPSVAELAGASYARIALANPEHAPYGRGALDALERAGVAERVRERLVFAENVRQTVQFAESGAVDVAISALSLMDSARHHWVVLPAGSHVRLTQTAAVVADRPQREAAFAFVAFLVGPRGREILARHRFDLP